MKAIINASDKSRIAKPLRDVDFKNRMIVSVVDICPCDGKNWVEISKEWANVENLRVLNEAFGKRGQVLEVLYVRGGYYRGRKSPASVFFNSSLITDKYAWKKLLEHETEYYWRFKD